jgi:serine/threonine protein kinase
MQPVAWFRARGRKSLHGPERSAGSWCSVAARPAGLDGRVVLRVFLGRCGRIRGRAAPRSVPMVREDSPRSAPTEGAAAIRVGDVLLGKYRVERELGKGGMGVVLAVRHVELDEVFALKVLLPEAVDGPEAVERFLREARITARLQSEHTARVFDVGRLEPARPYMLMEHLRGSDLRQVLAERGPLAPAEAVEHILQACEILAEAHAQGVVHRDIKPSNLFLAERPGGGRGIKLLDFGISKVLSAEGADLTSSRAVLGSPLYMSPEQMMRSKSVSTRTDVWALGAVLYELLTGSAPFAAESLTAVVGHVLNHEPPPPSHLRAGVPGWLDAAVMRCLRKAPEDRYQTVDELAIVLREGGARQAAEATPAPAVVPSPVALEETVKSEPLGLALTTGPTDAATSVERPRRPSRSSILVLAALGLALAVVWLARSSSQRGPLPQGSVIVPPPAEHTAADLPTAATSTSPDRPLRVFQSAEPSSQPAAMLPAPQPAKLPSTSTSGLPVATSAPGLRAIPPAGPLPGRPPSAGTASASPSAQPAVPHVAPPPTPTVTESRPEGVY